MSKDKSPKSFSEQLDVVAVAGEACILLGCTLLIFLHYFSSAEGLSVISTAGIVLGDFVACAALHFAIKRKTPLLKGASFTIWLGLTMLTAILAAAVWMYMQHAAADGDLAGQIAAKEEKLANTKDKATKAEIRADLKRLREEQDKPAFDKKSSWPWIYHTGVKVLPFPCGIAGLAILLALGIWKSDAEDAHQKPETSQKPATAPRQPAVSLGHEDMTLRGNWDSAPGSLRADRDERPN